jgi:hypothetical protein
MLIFNIIEVSIQKLKEKDYFKWDVRIQPNTPFHKKEV